MMFSNNPLFLRDQDFHSKHADMIDAARAEPASDSEEARPEALSGLHGAADLNVLAELAAAKAEIERLKEERIASGFARIKSQITSRKPTEAEMAALEALAAAKAADRHKIGTQLRIRLPADYVFPDGPDLRVPGISF